MRKSIFTCILSLFFIYSCFTEATGQNSGSTPLFVNVNLSTGQNDGTNWSNAYRSLQSALEKANRGDEIWVARGVYFPDANRTDRTKSFNVPAGVMVYGGFEGSEERLDQRIPGEHPTILSGNIGIQNDSTDNTFHVVQMINPDSTTLIDGFTISGGFAVRNPAGADQDVGAGIRIRVDADAGWPVISNCTFRNNTARRGGAISAQSVAALSGGLSVRNSFFENNHSTSFGGAIYVKVGQDDSITNIFEACQFMSNSSGHIGGAIYFADMSGDIKLRDCMFFQNFASTMGGAINIVQENNNSHYELETTTFFKNLSFGEGGAINYVSQKPLNAKIDIFRSDFSENLSINASGGALNVVNFGGQLGFRVDQSDFRENEASEDGAAISFYDELFGTSDIRLTNSRIENNKVNSFSGSGYFYNQEFVRRGTGNKTIFYNTLFAKNDGAYTYLGSSSGTNETYIYSCTFYQNGSQPIINWSKLESQDLINPIHIWIKNSIIWEPQQFSVEDILVSVAPGDGTSLYEYNLEHNIINAPNCEAASDVYLCGPGNLFALNPQLKDPLNGDFSLKQCSPAINAGLKDSLLNALNQGYDLNLNTRILEDIPDIGAFEGQSFTFEVESIRLPNCPGGQDGAVRLSVPVDQTYEIRWASGMSTTDQLNQLASGDYSFTLTTDDRCTYMLPFTLNGPDTMQVDYTINPASGPDKRDGGISLGQIRGGTAPHRVAILQGGQTFTLGNLAPGTYELRVTDRNGCIIMEEVVISFVSDVINLENGIVLRAFPNPVQKGREIRLDWSGMDRKITELRLMDLMGRTLWNDIRGGGFSQGYTIETALLDRGVYILRLMDEKGSNHSLKLVVR